MAHFAQVNETNTVQEVIVIANDACDDLPFPESEPVGQAYIASIGLTGTWLQTSYNGNFRGLYAGPTMVYNSALDQFQYPTPTIEA
jgi:hypothetical protein